MKVKNFNKWNLSEKYLGDAKLPSLVEDFISEIDDFLVKIRDIYPHQVYQVSFEDWWCISSEDYFNSYFESSLYKNLQAAENEEAVERDKETTHRNITDFFVIEFHESKQSGHSYFVVGINMKSKEALLNKVPEKLSEKFTQAFNNSMKKNFPTVYSAKKYGL